MELPHQSENGFTFSKKTLKSNALAGKKPVFLILFTL